MNLQSFIQTVYSKDFLRRACQHLLGFDTYLFIFSLFTGWRIQHTGHEKAFTYFTTLIANDGVILDIGANIGIMTVMLAKKCNRAVVYAIEPMPANSKALQKVIRFHKLANVTIFAMALGDENAQVNMIMPVIHHARMQGLSHIMEAGKKEEAGEKCIVPMQRMDDMPALQQLTKITAIKMDVENFEYQVLKGGEALLKKHRPIIYCELWDNHRRSQCIAFIKNIGYRIKVYSNGGLIDFTGQPAINFFFMP